MGIVSGVVRWALGWMGDSAVGSICFDLFILGLVLRIPVLGRFICPLDVAGDLARCLRTNFDLDTF